MKGKRSTDYADSEKSLMRRQRNDGEAISSIARQWGTGYQTMLRLLGIIDPATPWRGAGRNAPVSYVMAKRDQPPYDFTCPVCGMGVAQTGKRFETEADALACCAGVDPAAGAYSRCGMHDGEDGAK